MTERSGQVMTNDVVGTGRTALYRLYDADNRLLYVGISLNPAARWTQHAGDKPWWREIARTDVEWLSTRLEAVSAELRAIKTEQPIHNVADSPSAQQWYARRARHRPPGPAQTVAIPAEVAYWFAKDPEDAAGRSRAQVQRLRAGISQEVAARELHISFGTLSKRERGKTVPRGWKATEYVDWLRKLKPKPPAASDNSSQEDQ